MKKVVSGLILVLAFACKQQPKAEITVQEIVDKSIEDSGGRLYKDHGTLFYFRNRKYISRIVDKKKILERITFLDSNSIQDIHTNIGFTRYINDTLVDLPDSLANRYANSVNSVHYFARLPYGLNDKAVNKELLGEESIQSKAYYKVKVTFDQNGGGDDFDDVYLYWFNKETFKVDYLAYDFHVNGGGQRFRMAYNERYVNGIRFVDYENYKSKVKTIDILDIAKLFETGELELLSKIELSDIKVNKD